MELIMTCIFETCFSPLNWIWAESVLLAYFSELSLPLDECCEAERQFIVG